MTAIDHSQREHSLWSPSSFNQWANCPASALFTADTPREDSEASLRGTWMHEQVNRLLDNKEIDRYSEWYSEANVDDIMFVFEYVVQLIENCSLFTEADVWGEQVVGNSQVFGTSDLRIYDPEEKTLWVIDYKFGYGVVDAASNGQLRMYAVLADNEFEKEIKQFKLMIIQPTNKRRMVDIESLTSAELHTWDLNVLQPALEKAQQEDAEFIPGASQCKWCPASGSCPAQRDHAISVFEEYDTKREETLDYAKLLPLVDEIEAFIGGVRKQARNAALQGTHFKGYKLVEAVTRSKWADPVKAEKWLAARKIPKAHRTKTTVVGIAEAKRLVGHLLKDKPVLQKNFQELINKPKGDLALVPEEDPRPPVETDNPLLGDDLI